jgi:thiamine pyrophosphate-dependent acetolactate synthase large subunit-like protein
LAEVKFEQKEQGNPGYGCDLAPIDFIAFASAGGAVAFAVPNRTKYGPRSNLHCARLDPPALMEAIVDAEENLPIPTTFVLSAAKAGQSELGLSPTVLMKFQFVI